MVKHKKVIKKQNKSHAKLIIFLVLAGLIIIGLIIWAAISIHNANVEKEHKERLEQAVSFCEGLFDETTAIKKDTTKENLNDCKSRLDEIAGGNTKSVSAETIDAEKEQTKKLLEQVESAFSYLDWTKSANNFIDKDNIVKDTLEEKDIVSLDTSMKELSKVYQKTAGEKLEFLRAEFLKMQDAKNAVNGLFTSIDRAEVRQNVRRAEYNEAKEKVDNLKQESLKQNLNEALDKVLPVIEEQERIARELAEKARREREEEERKIAASWHRLDVSPYYINQFAANIKSGCEAASLLMAAKYKGYIRGMSYQSFASNMPKSDTDPNQGFYLSMTDLEPRDEAHWIAPAPLAAYGAASGISVANVSGASIDQLDNEVKNGNPVIIYLTFGFNDPKEYSKGVPRNLHVMVLSGFNSYTGEQQFYDPWPVNGNNPTLSKARTEYLYNASGHRALVVR